MTLREIIARPSQSLEGLLATAKRITTIIAAQWLEQHPVKP
jgi:hypothetical protein